MNAYDKGRSAFNNAVKLFQNPYKKNTEEWVDWIDGWEDAANDEDCKQYRDFDDDSF